MAVKPGTPTYNGYTASLEYRAENGCMIGHILGLSDIVGFHCDWVGEMKEAFEEVVDD
jgi:predicted HicB family RNase H-like nuclease